MSEKVLVSEYDWYVVDADYAGTFAAVAAGDINPIGGINNVTSTGSATEVDITDFDSGGKRERIVSNRTVSINISGFMEEDPTDAADGERDAGQVELEKIADKVGSSSLGIFLAVHPDGTRARKFRAYVDGPYWGFGGGGGNDSANAWSATLMVSGDFTDTTKPT